MSIYLAHGSALMDDTVASLRQLFDLCEQTRIIRPERAVETGERNSIEKIGQVGRPAEHHLGQFFPDSGRGASDRLLGLDFACRCRGQNCALMILCRCFT